MTRQPPTYDLRIGELVLDGMSPGEQRALVAALEGELGRLLAADTAPFARPLPGRGRQRIAVDRLDAGDVAVAPDASPRALGVAAAQTIVRQLGTLAGGPRPGRSRRP